MAKRHSAVRSVEDVKKDITVTPNVNGKTVLAKYSKDKFNALMRAIINDPNYTTEKAVVKNGELVSIEKIAVSQGFRKFIKHALEQYGVDSAESEKVLSGDFTVDNADGLYDFFATALYEYIESGNKFDLIPKEDFKGSICLKDRPETTKVVDTYQPKTREHLGTYEVTKKKHKVLSVKSSCPKYLRKRMKKK